MFKKVGLGLLLSLFLTWLLWRITAALQLPRSIDDLAFFASPIIAIVAAVFIVRIKYGNTNNNES